MTIESHFFALYSNAPAPPKPGASREDQLAALTAFAQAQLERAFLAGRDTRAASRFLLACHQMLDRWQQYRDKAGPTPAQQAADRNWELDRLAVANMLGDRPDILQVFMTYREAVDRENAA